MDKLSGYWTDLLKRFGPVSRPAVAIFDPLTGLPTRSAVITEVGRALARSRHKMPVGLLIIEFSSMLESDEPNALERALIAQLGTLLRSWVASEHTVGHLRDREFAVVTQGLAMGDVERLADDVVERVRSDPALQGRRGQIATIVGVGYTRDAGCNASQLMSLADIALHYALATGRSWHAIVEKPVQARVA